MIETLKKQANHFINEIVLRRFGLKLSFNVGSDPVQDMVRLLKGHDVKNIVDGGAHTGDFSLKMAFAFPLANVHAFEPASEIYRALKSATEKWSRINSHRLALGLSDELRVFHINASAQTSSLKRPSAEGEKYFGGLLAEAGQEEVHVVTLAGFCESRGIDCLDIIKLDLQGHELEALRGGGEFVSMAKMVFIEIQFQPIYEGSARFSELEAFLRLNGLELYQFYGLVRSPKNGQILYGDALFVRPSLLAAA